MLMAMHLQIHRCWQLRARSPKRGPWHHPLAHSTNRSAAGARARRALLPTRSRQALHLPALLCILLLATACSPGPRLQTPAVAASAPGVPTPASAPAPTAPDSASATTTPLAEPSAPTGAGAPSQTAPDSASVTATPGAAPPVYGYEIIQTYPHDPGAFTEGLFWDGGYLYESTGEVGRSGIRKYRLTTGDVLQSVSLAAPYFGEGIAAAGSRLYQLTWRSHTGFIYDQATFRPIGRFTYPTEGWGLTYDGRSLIMSDGSNILHFLDPATLTQTAQITVTAGGQPVMRLNELEYVKDQIYANVWQTDRIAIISAQTGAVLAWIDCSGLRPAESFSNPDAVLNGIAYDPAGDHLFVTGKLWPNLYEIRLLPR